ncbi:NAD(P)/FAD-dependent oxidoreductase [Shewanella fidelis]|uniref:FAD-dependent oxidoreductase n=1 Tax=Shewanella fidelis TaxID=173509 RepID=A0AAW8NLD8_9GAMM|nr:FAD-dependent oxidoreductase [Shewanella fidelis]MDR8523501.1 FAD-dependent oxidoreductase [Shewanella fidelis]MDW4813266.1 FAD-dependent oxidoreductase [Shewanella fidelis]MDW4817362.1 FAD-dependent oxidoreductase [Shewanella fidelis]MDW4821282.1 FAD-dependent oxidoreductase [Shewanella fidelis]MDW4824640.1 FAD-dependent oxidoreductase [Shewanella fidelis]
MLDMNQMNDIATLHKEQITVVGAGIVGLSAAIELMRAGFQVTVIDKQGVGEGASKGNAGHFATEQVFPLADPAMLPKLPGMLLDPLGPFRIQPRYFFKALPWFIRFLANMLPWRRAHNSRAIKSLNQTSISAIKSLVTFCDCEHLLTLNGSLLVFEGTAVKVVEKEFEAYRNAGVAVKMLTGDEVRLLEPSLTSNITHALYFTQVGHTANPHGLCLALAAKFKQIGGKILTEELVNVNVSAEGSDIVLQTQTAKRVSKRVLIASGAWSKPFAKQLGYSVPLETERGYHLMMPQKSSLSRPVASFERKFIITPMQTGTRLAGTVEFGGLAAPLVDARADCLFPHAKALLPQLFADAKVSDGERWMGFRPSMPDSLPVLGQSLKQSNVYFSFGHQHLGLTWSAITARLLAEDIQGKQPSIDLSPYRIDRFS